MIDIRYYRTEDKFVYTSKIIGDTAGQSKRYVRRLEKACIDGILDYGKAKNYIFKQDYVYFEFDFESVSDIDYDMVHWTIDSMIDFMTQLSKKTKEMKITNEN